jgi:small neutral amino acid transporter SnatA (MarC family)
MNREARRAQALKAVATAVAILVVFLAIGHGFRSTSPARS